MSDRYTKAGVIAAFLFRWAFAAVAVAAVTGCSSNGLTRVQTWEGAAVSNAAILKAPSAIKVQSVNGRETGNFLMDDLALDYELLPGTNTVVFTYKTIWAKSGIVRDKNESNVHVVETEPQQVVIDARAGEVYRFEVPEITSRSEAERFAADFHVRVVTDAGQRVATSGPYTAPVPSLPSRQGATATVVAGQAAGPASVQPEAGSQARAGVDSRLNTLDGLKLLWERASGEEKREFLKWAFD